MRALLTRSEPGIAATAVAVRALGWQVDLAPALRIVPRAPIETELAAARGAAHWAFVSTHAVEHGASLLEQLAKGARCYAVGPTTAAALAARGHSVTHADSGGGADGLLRLPPLQSVTGQGWVIVRGRGGLPQLPETLRQRGAQVALLEVYERVAMTSTALRAAWHDPDAVVVASGDGLVALLAAASVARIPVAAVPMLVPSERVAAQARAAGVARVIVCSGAGSAAVCAALRNEFDTPESRA